MDEHEAADERAGFMASPDIYLLDVPTEAGKIAAAIEAHIREEVGDLFITDFEGLTLAAVARMLRRSEGWV